MATTSTPLTTITTDTAALSNIIKSSASQLSSEAKTDLAAALAAAHQEFTDAKGAGASVWSALLQAVEGKPTATPPPAVKAA